MSSLVVHFGYGTLQLLRQQNAKVRLMLLIPLAQVLPIFLMGSTFLPKENSEWFLYTNLAWGFMASCTLQALVWTQTVINTSRLDMLLLVDGGLARWMMGFTAGLNVLYIISTALSTVVIAFVLGFPVHALLIMITLVASIPVTLGSIAFILGCEIRWGRMLHIVNSALDLLMVFSGVLYPIAALGSIFGMVALFLPTAQLNEFLRGGGSWHLMAALGLAGVYSGIGLYWVRRSVAHYRVTGVIGAK
ncbi:MAG: hypothetical protein Q4D79_02330 [Propionibacteriaceae bacterium]|nr:hypothetical protein [Propionibacteriaceae bacterium]